MKRLTLLAMIIIDLARSVTCQHCAGPMEESEMRDMHHLDSSRAPQSRKAAGQHAPEVCGLLGRVLQVHAGRVPGSGWQAWQVEQIRRCSVVREEPSG